MSAVVRDCTLCIGPAGSWRDRWRSRSRMCGARRMPRRMGWHRPCCGGVEVVFLQGFARIHKDQNLLQIPSHEFRIQNTKNQEVKSKTPPCPPKTGGQGWGTL